MAEIVKCDFCGFEEDWEESDLKHGTIWQCEVCGKMFCAKCFADKYSSETYTNMVNRCDKVYCPDCYKKGGKQMEELLMALLECTSIDLRILDDVGYNLGDIAGELVAYGIKPTLNDITDNIFRRGQRELVEAVENAIEERRDRQADADDTEEGEAEYDRLQEEIDELESLDPENDMGWYCNCLDTSCWFESNEEVYRKYIPEEIYSIECNMGFEFGV